MSWHLRRFSIRPPAGPSILFHCIEIFTWLSQSIRHSINLSTSAYGSQPPPNPIHKNAPLPPPPNHPPSPPPNPPTQIPTHSHNPPSPRQIPKTQQLPRRRSQPRLHLHLRTRAFRPRPIQRPTKSHKFHRSPLRHALPANKRDPHRTRERRFLAE